MSERHHKIPEEIWHMIQDTQTLILTNTDYEHLEMFLKSKTTGKRYKITIEEI